MQFDSQTIHCVPFVFFQANCTSRFTNQTIPWASNEYSKLIVNMHFFTYNLFFERNLITNSCIILYSFETQKVHISGDPNFHLLSYCLNLCELEAEIITRRLNTVEVTKQGLCLSIPFWSLHASGFF